MKTELEWISVKDDLPNLQDRVAIWVKFQREDSFTWRESFIDSHSHGLPNEGYIEPNSGVIWALDNEYGYEITHWAYIKSPDGKIEIGD